jgi:hypothetical protein
LKVAATRRFAAALQDWEMDENVQKLATRLGICDTLMAQAAYAVVYNAARVLALRVAHWHQGYDNVSIGES